MAYDVNHIGEQVLNSLDRQVKIYQSVYGLWIVKMKKDIF
jgi:hypothetical protein